MNILTTTDQAVCNAFIDALNMRAALKPKTPGRVCDGLTTMPEANGYLIAVNDNERFTIHILRDATEREAWQFFEELRGEATSANPRLEFVGPNLNPANN